MSKRKMAAPALVGQKVDISRALAVGRSQIAEANEVAQGMGCGAPFRDDGKFEGTRSEKAKYMRELNKRRVDSGQERLVNHDGGYGDET